MRAILTWHSIDGSGSPISVDRETFAAHVAFLASGAVRVTDVTGVMTARADENAAALTFDDGFANFASEAWPRLRDHGLPATVFVVSGHAGGTNAWSGRAHPGIPTLPLMDWDTLGRLAEEGVTLGAHSRTHPDLRGLDAAALADEVDGSAEAIASRTGRRPAVFAYPYGLHDTRVAGAARGFAAACTTRFRPLGTAEHPHRLPRLDAWYLRPGARIRGWGGARLAGYLRLRGALRAVRAVVTA